MKTLSLDRPLTIVLLHAGLAVQAHVLASRSPTDSMPLISHSAVLLRLWWGPAAPLKQVTC